MHSEPNLTALVARVDLLERQARLWRLSAVAGALVAVAASLPHLRPVEAQGEGTTLKAPVTVIGTAGRKLVSIDQDERGNAWVKVLNDDGKPGASVTADSGGLVSVNDAKGASSATLLSTDLGGSLSIRHANGQSRALLYSGTDGGALVLKSPDEKHGVTLGHSTKGGGQILLRGDRGRKDVWIPETD